MGQRDRHATTRHFVTGWFRSIRNCVETRRRFQRPRQERTSPSRVGSCPLRANQAKLKTTQANLDRAQLDMIHSVVRSRVDGVVISRNVELGQAVVASFQAPNL